MRKKEEVLVNEDLVKEAINGSKDAIASLIEMYYHDILYFAISKVGRQDGEDIAQQAIASIIKDVKTLKDPSKFKTWIMSVVYHGSLNHMKKTKQTYQNTLSNYDANNEALLAIEDEDRQFLPEEAFLNEELRQETLNIISTLPQNYADALRLRYHEGLSYHEIAEVMDVSDKKVKNDMYHGLALFKKRFEQKTGNQYHYSAVSAGALPWLTQLFSVEAGSVVPADMAARVLESAQMQIATATTGVATIGAAATGVATGMSSTTKVLVAALIVMGIGVPTAFALWPQDIKEQTQEQTQAIFQQEQTVANLDTEESLAQAHISIETVEDMIGKEKAIQLKQYESSGVDIQSWHSFLLEIGAEYDRSAVSDAYIYEIAILNRQDKQLMCATRQSENGGELMVVSSFGEIKDPPRIANVILMFP